MRREELEDLIRGCAILGTGGGGSPQWGLEVINAELKEGGEFKLAGLEEIPDEELVATPYSCGSLFPEEGNSEILSQDSAIECLKAFESLEEYVGRKFFAAFPGEIGGGTVAEALVVTARRGIPIIDADPVGRSVPGLQHTVFYIQEVPMAPIAVASMRGDVIILKEVADDSRAEAIVRAIAVINSNNIGMASHSLAGRDIKKAIIPRTLSQALAIGRAVREARFSNGNPVRAAVVAGKGYLLFEGKVAQASWKIEGGFTIGELSIAGEGDYLGQRYRIWYKNESIISWFDEEPDVMVPDLICVLDPKTGEAITNPNCREGMEVAVVGYPASTEVWRSPRGLEVFGPKDFGYEIEYRKIEENRRLR